MYENLNLKPAGGIRHIELYLTGDVESLSFKEGYPDGISLKQGASSTPLSPILGQSSLLESITFKDGPKLCSHTLDIAVTPEQIERLLTEEALRRISDEGCTAVVEFISGESILVGWSPKFGFEQPLRIEKIEIIRGSKRSDLPHIRVLLKSLDDSVSTPLCKVSNS
ncbi:MAG: hypothetical protein UHY58_00670 [Alistipes sp.]|nr:hypothetical protein [Alistipes sp.]